MIFFEKRKKKKLDDQIKKIKKAKKGFVKTYETFDGPLSKNKFNKSYVIGGKVSVPELIDRLQNAGFSVSNCAIHETVELDMKNFGSKEYSDVAEFVKDYDLFHQFDYIYYEDDLLYVVCGTYGDQSVSLHIFEEEDCVHVNLSSVSDIEITDLINIGE